MFYSVQPACPETTCMAAVWILYRTTCGLGVGHLGRLELGGMRVLPWPQGWLAVVWSRRSTESQPVLLNHHKSVAVVPSLVVVSKQHVA